jgi:hypothetical protein
VAVVPAEETDLGTADIVGVDLKTNQPLVISTAPGDQTAPAVSGSTVVWQDNQHSCPTCERDIRGKDVATGAEFEIATGAADQGMPAIEGRTVVWLEQGGGRIRLFSAEVGSQTTREIAATSSPNTTFGRPVMSKELIVWADQTEEQVRDGKLTHSTIRAYNRATGNVQVVAKTDWVGVTYAVSGQRVVWTDPRLWMADLGSGTTTMLEEGFTTAPTISGDTVVWSGKSPDGDNLDIYGLDRQGGRRVPLVSGPGNQTNPEIIGDILTWQNDAEHQGRIERKPLPGLFATATVKAQRQPKSATIKADPQFSVRNHTGSFTRPVYKGVHLPLGGYDSVKQWGGWYFSTGQPCNGITCAGVDPLGAPYGPFFGSFVLLDTELRYATGRGAPWGPYVADAMRGAQSTYGTRVVVRTYDNRYPTPTGDWNTADVTQEVLNLASSQDWVRHVQINNEPNLEWLQNCDKCKWTTSSQLYSWLNRDDWQLYYAINEFYSDVWWEINWYKNNHSDPTIRTRLQNMEIWTPPMADFYKGKDQQSFYVPLQGMVDLYDRMTYHTYPAPNFDAVGGTLTNNSWPYFSQWVRDSINNGTVRTMITEFGWNEGQMERADCNTGYYMAQHNSWPTSGNCAASDRPYVHTLDKDLQRFLTSAERHNAEVVAVWMTRGWKTPTNNDRTDGVDQNGNTRTWYHYYQWSSP